MTEVRAAKIAILISTRNRCALLQSVLHGIEDARQRAGAASEVIVADNGSSDDTAAFLVDWQAGGPGRHCLHVAEAGKCRALNLALRQARAPLLAFTDDDVIVPSTWLNAILSFFDRHPEFAAGMGPVRVPPDVVDPEVVRLAQRFAGPIPLFEADDGHDLSSLYGCNMFLRQQALERIGGFNEKLGPGAAGYCEDVDVAYRIRGAGMRIGYAPQAVIYHRIDPTRLNRQSFINYHVGCAQGRYLMANKHSVVREAGRLVDATISLLARSAYGTDAQRLKSLARFVHHRELLRLCLCGALPPRRRW